MEGPAAVAISVMVEWSLLGRFMAVSSGPFLPSCFSCDGDETAHGGSMAVPFCPSIFDGFLMFLLPRLLRYKRDYTLTFTRSLLLYAVLVGLVKAEVSLNFSSLVAVATMCTDWNGPVVDIHRAYI